MKFICDQMLGTLAKWLRIMGYDTLYGDGDDSELIKIAVDEKRVLITRDRELHNRYENSLLVEGTELENQIRSVMDSLDLRINMENALSRCTVCNTPVRKIRKDEVKGKVPPHAYETHDEFWICPDCKRIYWRGTHWENMKNFMEKLK